MIDCTLWGSLAASQCLTVKLAKPFSVSVDLFNSHHFVAFQLGCYCPTVIASFVLHTLQATVVSPMPFAPEDMDLYLRTEFPFH